MTPDVFASATLFAVAASFTPGPNNAMLLASGVNYGFARTVPHIAGVTIGYAIMFAAVAFGVGQFIFAHPALYRGLQIASAIYLIWLAWRIATADGEARVDDTSKPQTFFEAALFQWINPKGVAAALTASASFIKPDTFTQDLAIISAMIFLVSLTSASTWALFGQALRAVLADARRRRMFNFIMAAALLVTLWPLLSPLIAGA